MSQPHNISIVGFYSGCVAPVAMHSRRSWSLKRSGIEGFNGKKKIWISIVIGICVGSAFAILNSLYGSSFETLAVHSIPVPTISSLVTCEASNLKNAQLLSEIKSLKRELRLAEERKEQAEKQIELLGERKKVGPFGTVKWPTANPRILPDESVNPRLAKFLKKVAQGEELIVSLANSNVIETLQIWFTSIKNAGIKNYLVIALDDNIASFCKANGVPVYQRDPDEGIDSIGRTGGNHEVSALKFRILREFLQLGYSVLLSDVDIVYLQNPFDHLHRDADVESMSDGHDNNTAYGFDDVHNDPKMGWSRYAHTMRIWVYNSGFFYIRPTIPAIELLDRIADRVSRQKEWDQRVFNEELFMPSRPGYFGLYASKRTMDIYSFMNSKVLFTNVRKDARLKKMKPVVVHVNYHPDKLARMKAVWRYYVDGQLDALSSFPDGSE